MLYRFLVNLSGSVCLCSNTHGLPVEREATWALRVRFEDLVLPLHTEALPLSRLFKAECGSSAAKLSVSQCLCSHNIICCSLLFVCIPAVIINGSKQAEAEMPIEPLRWNYSLHLSTFSADGKCFFLCVCVTDCMFRYSRLFCLGAGGMGGVCKGQSCVNFFVTSPLVSSMEKSIRPEAEA